MTLLKISELIKPIDNEVSEILSNKFYLDDLVHSVSTPQEAIKLIPKINNLLKLFNLQTHKWASNDKEVIESIPIEHRTKENTFTIKETPLEEEMSDSDIQNCPKLSKTSNWKKFGNVLGTSRQRIVHNF